MIPLVIGLLGLAIFVLGLGLWSVPLACMATGAALVRLSFVLSPSSPPRGEK